MTLVEFLLARIAEDEAAAQAGAGRPSYSHYGDTAAEETLEMARNEGVADAGPAHFDRWLPSRVLAECEAKRRIVEAESGRWQIRDDAPIAEIRTDSWSNRVTVHFDTGGEESMTNAQFRDRYEEPVLSDTLRLLALPYADHPDYREEWRP